MKCISLSYSYNEDGLRVGKRVSWSSMGVEWNTEYYYNGSVLIGMKKGDTVQRFSYDAQGKVVSVNYNGAEYYYVRNAQGDIVKLIDGSGSTVVEYTYDSWGKVLSVTGSLATTLGENQPFRYRGYVYDNDTNLYYLQSRYYNPAIGRFISSDVYLSTGQGVLGHNSYVYCLNNPLILEDQGGAAAHFIDRYDVSDAGIGGISATGGSGGAAASPNAGIAGLTVLVSEIVAAFVCAVEAATNAAADIATKIESALKAEYYGVIVLGDEFVYLTGAMNLDDAIVWANTAAVSMEVFIPHISIIDSLRKKSRWGLYTLYYDDAYDIAWILGGGLPPVGPELSKGRGYYWHFHTALHKFFGFYEHFHIWFGSPEP